MYIDLKWTNVNSGNITTNIYRSLTTLDKSNLGTPIVVLNNKETTYRDTNVLVNTTYNYVIEFVFNGNKVSTRNFVMTAQYVRGPGSPVVAIGDQNYGFMDIVSIGRIIAIWSEAGMSTVSVPDIPFGPGIKYTYGNKVYICALMPAYQVGPTLATVTPLLNNLTGLPVTIDGLSYLMRLAKVIGPSWDGVTKVTSATDFDEFQIKFVLPQMAALANQPGEYLGKVNSVIATNVIIGRESIGGTIATRTGINNSITWLAASTATTTTQFIPLILELVEGS